MNEHAGGVVAAVVGLTVLSVVLTTNFLGLDAASADRQSIAARRSAVEFSRTLTKDFRNLGMSNSSTPLQPDSFIALLDTVSSTRAFEFIGRPSTGALSATIRYEWVVAGTITVGDSTVTYYDVTRFVDGKLVGRSSGAVTDLSIRLLDANGAEIGVGRDIRQIELGLQIVSDLGSGPIAEWVHLDEIIHPRALSHLDDTTS